MLYLFSYDLQEGKDSTTLIKALREMQPTPAIHVLKSQWVIESDKTAKELGEYFLNEYLDDDARILVNSLDPSGAVSFRTCSDIEGVEVLERQKSETVAAKVLRRLDNLEV